MPQHISRRSFLGLAGLGGGAVLFGRAPRAFGDQLVRPAPSSAGAPTSATRVLVMLEMAGGNDGFSMAPPSDPEALARLRPSAFGDPSSFIDGGHDVVLHPGLAGLAGRRLAVVDGLGSTDPDESHFEMLRRWWDGDQLGTARLTTGFLGRLCDALDEGAPVTGLSIGGASTPALVSTTAGTLGLPDPGSLWWLETGDDEWASAFRDALGVMGRPDAADPARWAYARAALAAGLESGAAVTGLGELPDDLPDSALVQKLAMARQVIASDIGVRVIHVPVDGDFDTHDDHLNRHTSLMEDLGTGVAWFLDQIERDGAADRVLVATSSEFGRRPAENGDGGLDHGTASSALVLGPVTPGRFGEPVDFARLDDDGNVAVTVAFDRYYSSLAEHWFGVDGARVTATGASPLDGIM